VVQTLENKVIGEHSGAMYYTLGQRTGLGIGGVKGAVEAPWYVVAKDVENNVLVVAQGHDHPLLFSHALEAADLSWISGEAPGLPLHCAAKIRYRQQDQRCTISGIVNGRCQVEFERPQRAVTLGQSVVFYEGEACLGGGVIERVVPGNFPL
jgi:tRNA-specific 2-thiouridylase